MLFEQTLANHDFKYNFKEYTKDVAELPYSEDGNRIYYPNVEQKNFEKIPGAPIGYWMHKDFLNIFINGNVLGNKYRTLAGSSTGDNKQFLRLWHEVDNNKVGYGLKKEYSGYSYKWIPCSKGDSFRRWYGNFEYLMNWDNNGEAIKYFVTHNPNDPKTTSWSRRLFNTELYFHQAITWSKVLSGKFSVRYLPEGFIMESASCGIMPNEKWLIETLALMNSKYTQEILNIINPTLGMQVGDIKSIPLYDDYIQQDKHKHIDHVAKENISISKSDWDAHETSWDFQRNELLSIDKDTYMENINYEIEKHFEETGEHICIDPAAPQLDSLAWRIEQYKKKWEHKFKQLHENEEELNRQFIDIYGLQDELTPDVPLSEITILQQGEISIESEQQ